MGKSVTQKGKKSDKKDNRITTRLNKDDLKLFKIALEKHNLGEGKLAKKIISNWLFNNKLQLGD